MDRGGFPNRAPVFETDDYMNRLNASNSTGAISVSSSQVPSSNRFSTNDSRCVTTDDLTQTGRAREFDSRDTSPHSPDDDFYMVPESPSDAHDYASWVLQSDSDSLSSRLSTSDLLRQIKDQVGVTAEVTGRQKEIALQLQQQNGGVNIQQPLHGDAQIEFSAQTTEESFLKHSMDEVYKRDKEIKRLEQALEEKDRRDEQLQEERDHLRDRVHTLQSSGEGERLRAQLKDCERAKYELREKVKELETIIEETQKEHSCLDAVRRDAHLGLEEKVKEYKRKWETLQGENESLTEALKRAEAEKGFATEDVNGLRDKYNASTNQIQNLKRQVDVLETALRESDKKKTHALEESEALRKEHEKSKAAVKTLTAEREQLNADLGIVRSNYEQVQLKSEQWEREVQIARKELKEREQKEDNWKSIISQLQARLEQSNKGDSKLEQEIRELRKLLAKTDQDNQKLKDSLRATAPRLEALSDLEEKLKQQVSEIHRLKQMVEQKDSEKQQAIYYFQYQMQVLMANYNNGNDSAGLAKQIEELNRKVAEMETQRSAEREKLLNCENVCDNLRKSLEHKEREIAEKERALQDMNAQVDAYKLQDSIREEDFKQERNRINQLKDEHDREKEKWHMLERELQMQVKKFKDIKDEEDSRALQRGGPMRRGGPSGYEAGNLGDLERSHRALGRSQGELRASGRDRMEQSIDLGALQAEKRAVEGDVRGDQQEDEGWGGYFNGLFRRDSGVGGVRSSERSGRRPTLPKSVVNECPFCGEKSFPDVDALQVHINEDHQD